MSQFREMSISEYRGSPFREIGGDWMLVTAGNRESCNTMTASWGGMGVLWNKNVAFIFIRPSRYTKEFIDREERLSLCFLDESRKKELSYLGRVSGRDEDKIGKTGLTVLYDGETPYFEQSERVMLCRKLYRQELDPRGFLDASIDSSCYPGKDYHTVYVCEIEKILQKNP